MTDPLQDLRAKLKDRGINLDPEDDVEVATVVEKLATAVKPRVVEVVAKQPEPVKTLKKGKKPQEIQKNPVGRPLKYKTKEELQEAIDDYFKSCLDPEPVTRKFVRTINGEKKVVEEPVIDRKLPTTTGLARYIGLSRPQLINYGKTEEFYNTIKKAKEFVEECWEQELGRTANVTGVIFNLKNNHKWKDEIVNQNNNTNVNDALDRIERMNKGIVDVTAETINESNE